jgi:hypothetical protein
LLHFAAYFISKNATTPIQPTLKLLAVKTVEILSQI